MPKLAISKDEEMNRILRGSIKNAQELQGMNARKISKATGIPVSTLYERIREPEKFTVRELRLVCGVLKYSEEEKERIAKYAI